MHLSVLMITKNSDDVLGGALNSVKGLWDELLIADDYSIDKTREIIDFHGGKTFFLKEMSLGERRQWLVQKVKKGWILVLDSDERVSRKLYKEIKEILKKKNDELIDGYSIPYKNFFLGKPIYYGGEQYSKVRLFRVHKGHIKPTPIHEDIIIGGNITELKGYIYHYSYRSLSQLFKKFIQYANVLAVQKYKNGEQINLKKLFCYAPHMFWARYFKEKGYKDGWRGFVLAFAFAYMEEAIYVLLLWHKKLQFSF